MNWLDGLIILALGVSIFWGFKDGLIKAVIFVAGTILGIYLASQFAEPLADYLSFTSNQSAARMMAFAIIFIAVLIVTGILAWGIAKLVHSIPLVGWIDRLLGALLGAFLGATLIAAILANWVTWIGPNEIIQNSFLARVFLDKLPWLMAILPVDLDKVRAMFP
jgi:membrane protein required for colicin V production